MPEIKLTEFEREVLRHARAMRESLLTEVRDRIQSMQPDVSGTAEEHKVGFRSGFRQNRDRVIDLLNLMAEGKDPDDLPVHFG